MNDALELMSDEDATQLFWIDCFKKARACDFVLGIDRASGPDRQAAFIVAVPLEPAIPYYPWSETRPPFFAD